MGHCYNAPVHSLDVIINVNSGAGQAEALRHRLTQQFESAALTPRLRFARGGVELIRLAESAGRGQSAAVVAGGGDGTVSAVAAALAGTGKALGVLPLGTFNYFAQHLGIPTELAAAVGVIAAGHARTIDVGEVNGRLFLNNSSLGLYPSIIRERERGYRRWGRSRWAAYVAVGRALTRRVGHMTVRLLQAEGREVSCRTPLIFIGNNEYQIESFNLRGRRCFARGELALYVTAPVGRLGLLRLAMQALAGQLRAAQEIEVSCTREVWVETRRRRLPVVLDGEVAVLESPLHYQVRRDALRVLVPQV